MSRRLALVASLLLTNAVLAAADPSAALPPTNAVVAPGTRPAGYLEDIVMERGDPTLLRALTVLRRGAVLRDLDAAFVCEGVSARRVLADSLEALRRAIPLRLVETTDINGETRHDEDPCTWVVTGRVWLRRGGTLDWSVAYDARDGSTHVHASR